MVLLVPAGPVLATPSAAAPAVPGPEQSTAGETSADVKVHDTVVFTLSRQQGGRSAVARARAASEALKLAIATEETESARVAKKGSATVVFAGPVPVVELYEVDAEAAGAASLDVYAATIASRVENAVRSEKKRTAIAGTVFSVSLVVFFGLIALYVIRKVGEFATRARDFAQAHPERIPAIRLQSLELVGPAALRGAVIAGVVVARWIAQLGLAYAWLIFSLSLFSATRPYTSRLTGSVVSPLSELAGRIAASLPLAIVALVCGVAVYLLLRFIQLFFSGVARGESTLDWLPADLALPTSLLLRGGIVATTLVFAAPIVTGDPEGALARSGSILLLALGLSSTPLLASGVVGAFTVYGRRLYIGHHAEVAGRTGRILDVGLLEIRLVDESGCEVRVPHLLTLVHPTRTLGELLRVEVELSAEAAADLSAFSAVLLETARSVGRNARVELVDIDAETARYRVTADLEDGKSAGDLRMSLAQAVRQSGIQLSGRKRGGA